MAKTILVIDDSPDFLELATMTLEGAGYAVQVAEGAAEATEILEEIRPDAILLDIMMPERNGLEFLENLRWDSRFEGVPVVVITAMSLEPEEREFVNAFSAACLKKSEAAQLPKHLSQLISK